MVKRFCNSFEFAFKFCFRHRGVKRTNCRRKFFTFSVGQSAHSFKRRNHWNKGLSLKGFQLRLKSTGIGAGNISKKRRCAGSCFATRMHKQLTYVVQSSLCVNGFVFDGALTLNCCGFLSVCLGSKRSHPCRLAARNKNGVSIFAPYRNQRLVSSTARNYNIGSFTVCNNALLRCIARNLNKLALFGIPHHAANGYWRFRLCRWLHCFLQHSSQCRITAHGRNSTLRHRQSHCVLRVLTVTAFDSNFTQAGFIRQGNITHRSATHQPTGNLTSCCLNLLRRFTLGAGLGF